jgi:hypothetical protein
VKAVIIKTLLFALWAMAVSAPNLGSTMIFDCSAFLLNSLKKKKEFKKRKTFKLI